jgi:hypothetical protein
MRRLSTRLQRFLDHWPTAVIAIGVLLTLAWIGGLIWLVLIFSGEVIFQ